MKLQYTIGEYLEMIDEDIKDKLTIKSYNDMINDLKSSNIRTHYKLDKFLYTHKLIIDNFTECQLDEFNGMYSLPLVIVEDNNGEDRYWGTNSNTIFQDEYAINAIKPEHTQTYNKEFLDIKENLLYIDRAFDHMTCGKEVPNKRALYYDNPHKYYITIEACEKGWVTRYIDKNSLEYFYDYCTDGSTTEENFKDAVKYTKMRVGNIDLIDDDNSISGRYGNKSVITQVCKDDDMPVTADGRRVDLMINRATAFDRLDDPDKKYKCYRDRLFDHLIYIEATHYRYKCICFNIHVASDPVYLVEETKYASIESNFNDAYNHAINKFEELIELDREVT